MIPSAARRSTALPPFAPIIAALILFALAPTAYAIDDQANPPANLDTKDDTGANGGARQPDDPFRKTDYKVDTKLDQNLSLSSRLRIRPPSSALDGVATDDRGLYLDQIYATYEKPYGGLRVGKYDNSAFGVTRDQERGPGIFGWDSPLDAYRLNRALGVNPFAKLDGGLAGSTRLDASLFRPEDAAASTPIGAPTREPAAGGSARTPSVALSLDGSNALRVQGLGYHLGMQHMTPDPADNAGARQGMAAGLRYGAALGDGNKLSTAAEIGYMRQENGAGNDTLRPGMALQGALNDTWRAFGNYSEVRQAGSAPTLEPPTAARNYGAGVGYLFDQGPSVDLAWTRKKTEREPLAEESARDSVGLRMRYDLKF